MGTFCRTCLGEFSDGDFKNFFQKNDLVSYLDMLKALLPGIEIQNENILCSTCCAELVLSYNFLMKVQVNNSIFLEKNIQYGCKIENVKDPLEEGSCDEFFKQEDTSDIKFNLTTFEDFTAEQNNEFKDDINFNEASSSSEKCDDELLLNNLSDLSVSPENLIFPRGRFKCQICDKFYFTSAGLNAHHEVHSPKKPSAKKKRLRRQHKQNNFNQTSDIKQEEDPNNHTNDIEKAGMESETSTAQNETKIKLQKEKQIKPKKVFPCHVCGKEMISASKLRYHLVMHTGEKDFLCSMCPKAYSTIYALKHHFRSHSGYRPYECKFCGDRFYRPTTLKSHVRRHTGERPYGCEICGKRFIQHSSMTTHIKLNHMSKTIPCPHCDKKYARQTDLNTHLLSHTGDKPFSCQLCPSRFVRQANLNKHMKQQHSEKFNETKNIHDNLKGYNKELSMQVIEDEKSFN